MTTFADAKIALAELLTPSGRGRISPTLLNEALVLVLDALADEKLSLAGGTLTGNLVLSGAPSSDLHPASKAYVDAVAAGLDPKQSVKCATTANITLSGEQTLDGVLTSASRVLVKNQSTASQNGIYVSAAGAWARATDMDAWAEVPGAWVIIEEGTTLADSGWVSTANAGGTLGSTSITWSQITTPGGGGGYEAGDSPSFANLTVTGQATIPLQTLTDATNIAWNMNTGAKAYVTLAGNRTVSAVLNAVAGTTYLLWVAQDATGSRTLSWTTSGAGSFDFGLDGAPTLTTTASKVDLLAFEAVSIGGTLKLRFAGIKKGFG